MSTTAIGRNDQIILDAVDDDAFLDRFDRKVIREPFGEDPCWVWCGALSANKYGALALPKDLTAGAHSVVYAHRVAFIREHGRVIGKDLTIDHLCRNKLCVNPAHLEEVTLAENSRRGIVMRITESVRV